MKISHKYRRQRFIKKLDSTKKLFSSVLSPAVLVLSSIHNALKKIRTLPVISQTIVVTSQNAGYAISDGIDAIKRAITLPTSIKSKYRMRKIKTSFLKSFNKFYGYDWLKKDATSHYLRNEKQKILSQIDNINIFRMQLRLKEHSPKLEDDLKYANMLLHQKKNELRHINEYMAISNSLNIEQNRIQTTFRQISYSTISFVARTTIAVLSALCSSNPILNHASSILL